MERIELGNLSNSWVNGKKDLLIIPGVLYVMSIILFLIGLFYLDIRSRSLIDIIFFFMILSLPLIVVGVYFHLQYFNCKKRIFVNLTYPHKDKKRNYRYVMDIIRMTIEQSQFEETKRFDIYDNLPMDIDYLHKSDPYIKLTIQGNDEVTFFSFVFIQYSKSLMDDFHVIELIKELDSSISESINILKIK